MTRRTTTPGFTVPSAQANNDLPLELVRDNGEENEARPKSPPPIWNDTVRILEIG